jgi:hypothetical protein
MRPSCFSAGTSAAAEFAASTRQVLPRPRRKLAAYAIACSVTQSNSLKSLAWNAAPTCRRMQSTFGAAGATTQKGLIMRVDVETIPGRTGAAAPSGFSTVARPAGIRFAAVLTRSAEEASTSASTARERDCSVRGAAASSPSQPHIRLRPSSNAVATSELESPESPKTNLNLQATLSSKADVASSPKTNLPSATSRSDGKAQAASSKARGMASNSAAMQNPAGQLLSNSSGVNSPSLATSVFAGPLLAPYPGTPAIFQTALPEATPSGVQSIPADACSEGASSTATPPGASATEPPNVPPMIATPVGSTLAQSAAIPANGALTGASPVWSDRTPFLGFGEAGLEKDVENATRAETIAGTENVSTLNCESSRTSSITGTSAAPDSDEVPCEDPANNAADTDTNSLLASTSAFTANTSLNHLTPLQVEPATSGPSSSPSAPATVSHPAAVNTLVTDDAATSGGSAAAARLRPLAFPAVTLRVASTAETSLRPPISAAVRTESGAIKETAASPAMRTGTLSFVDESAALAPQQTCAATSEIAYRESFLSNDPTTSAMSAPAAASAHGPTDAAPIAPEFTRSASESDPHDDDASSSGTGKTRAGAKGAEFDPPDGTSSTAANPKRNSMIGAAPTAEATNLAFNAANSPAISPSPTANGAANAQLQQNAPPPDPSAAHQMLDSAPSSPGGKFVPAAGQPTADSSGASQVHVGVHTSAFGNLEIHTVIDQNQVGVSIHGDHELARWFSSEVGTLETGLKNQHLGLSGVTFDNARSGVQTATGFQQGQSRQDFSQAPGSIGASLASDAEAPVSETDPESALTFAPSVESPETRLSILV